MSKINPSLLNFVYSAIILPSFLNNSKIMPQEPVLALSQKLIEQVSITPNDGECQNILAKLLADAGFNITRKRYADVDNLFAWHGEDTSDSHSLMFVGHTDVVPVGDEKSWSVPPFSALIKDNKLYGRGAADMKAAVACFTLAIIDFVKRHPKHKGKIALMLTSDEEGIAINGIKRFMPFIAQNHDFDYCIVGEPSSSQQMGDVVRIGRRGSLHVEITIHGKQGHVAFPENAKNPVFLAAKFIDSLSTYQWDEGNEDFPPTSFQISSVKTSSTTSNIIPADLTIIANFRYPPVSTELTLAKQLASLLKDHRLKYSLKWTLSGLPFHSKSTLLKHTLAKNIKNVTGLNPIFNAAGGTSDGRFVAPFGIDVVELGLVNKTIHQVDEHADIDDIIKLKKVYDLIIAQLLC